MKKIILTILTLGFLVIPNASSSVSFDDNVMKSVVKVEIHDAYSDRLLGSGTGINFGLGEILTNYHVAEDLINDPSRYTAYACTTSALNTTPNCKYKLSAKPEFGGESKYDERWDLALLYVNKVLISGEWQSPSQALYQGADLDEVYSDLNSVDISSYINNYKDLAIGETVTAVGYPDYADGKTIQVSGKVLRYVYDSNQPLVVSDFKISFGNSGGPVFNDAGELLGVTVKCKVDANKRCIEGLFIPLPTVNWWFTNATDRELVYFEGRRIYVHKGSADVYKQVMCMLDYNAHYDAPVSTNSCTCNTGYQKNPTTNQCTLKINECGKLSALGYFVNDRGLCVSMTQYCTEILGPNSRITRINLLDWQCKCNDGYQINNTTQQCIKNPPSPNSDDMQVGSTIDTKLVSRLKGKILLQVESHGEAWYLDPISLKRYYLRDGSVAYEALRKFGLGITNLDLSKIPIEGTANIGNQTLVNRLRGRILLQVQEKGEAWYLNPSDGRRYYLKNGEEAYRIMRVLSLGITDADLSKVPIGDL